ncbi:MAG: LysM peptidoglycan-binding domain-containing protein [Methylobacillus sp.]|jgi:membrane-bound lytic murein transglycosylase D|nr:LysM peptidoglycan-binding domain-containing protein [Methylobacillus sp.]
MLKKPLLKVALLALFLAPAAYAETDTVANVADTKLTFLDASAAAPRGLEQKVTDTEKAAPAADENATQEAASSATENAVQEAVPASDENTIQETTLNEEAIANIELQPEQQVDLWDRIKDGYAMPDLDSPLTAASESWYAARPDYMNRMVERSQRYLFHIVEEVQKRGMPTEIALLPMVESAFNPVALSRSKASGIWQFIPSTGKNYGLKQNIWVDNRRDVTAATDAALTYLQKLYGMFGSWDLALAAYNAGEGTVMRAIERNRKHGLPTDYVNLPLPPETRNYVPKLQAIKNIVTHPEQYGLDLQPIANQPYFTTVDAPKQIDAALAAKLAGITEEEFKSLNPEYNRPVLASTDGEHVFLLPLGADETFQTNLAAYDKPLVSWQTYTAKRGDSLDKIAKKFGVSAAKLREANYLDFKGNKFKTTYPLLVPVQGEVTDATLTVEDIPDPTSSVSTKRYKVKKGDTLATVARRYGMSVQELRSLNHLKSDKIKNGQTLLVQVEEAAPKQQNKSASAHKTYVVQRGDTLYAIARKFDVSPSDIKRWNNLDETRITPGDKLKILNPDKA